MRHPKHAAVIRSFAVLTALVSVLVVSACSQPTGAERVAQQRAEYTATLNGFTVRETPIEPVMEEPMEGEETADDAMAADDAMEGESMDDEMMMPEVRQDVLPRLPVSLWGKVLDRFLLHEQLDGFGLLNAGTNVLWHDEKPTASTFSWNEYLTTGLVEHALGETLHARRN